MFRVDDETFSLLQRACAATGLSAGAVVGLMLRGMAPWVPLSSCAPSQLLPSTGAEGTSTRTNDGLSRPEGTVTAQEVVTAEAAPAPKTPRVKKSRAKKSSVAALPAPRFQAKSSDPWDRPMVERARMIAKLLSRARDIPQVYNAVKHLDEIVVAELSSEDIDLLTQALVDREDLVLEMGKDKALAPMSVLVTEFLAALDGAAGP